MPTITVHKADLYYLADLADTVTLAELETRLQLVKGELTLRRSTGEKVGTEAALQIPTDELELRIELNDTNRPDLWSVEGIARQLRNHARRACEEYRCFAPASQTDERQTDESRLRLKVEPALADLRPFIGAFLATGQAIDERGLRALIETQEALTRNFGRKRAGVSIGLYRGDSLTYPLHYRAMARDAVRFVPLAPATQEGSKWADGHPLTVDEILTTHPTGREYASLLSVGSHAEQSIVEQPLVPLLTDDSGEILSLIPIINSAGFGQVVPGTTALLVEASGVELDQVLLTLNILAANLCDRGWDITAIPTDYPYATPRGHTVAAPHPFTRSQRVALTEFERLLGEPANRGDIVDALAAYGVVTSLNEDAVVATAPAYRQDYLHAVDVIEDYAISRGYDSFAPTMPTDFTVGKVAPMTEAEDLVRDLLIGFGFEEVFCNILTSIEQLQRRMAIDEGHAGVSPFHGGDVVRVANVMNRNYAVVRDWILPSLLEIESHSLGALYPHRIFEVGEVAIYDPAANHGSQTASRAAGIVASEDASFDSAQSVIYALLGYLGQDFVMEPWQHPSFIPGRVALILDRQQQPLGFLGELSPQVLTNWGVRTPIAAFELAITCSSFSGATQ